MMRPFGYSESIEWEDGSTSIGVAHPITIAYIETPQLKIVVDTGATAETNAHANEVFKTREQHQYYVKKPGQDIHAFLNAHGTDVEEIDLVILTHTHVDHFAAAPLYKNARFLLHRKELSLAVAPPPYMQFQWRDFSRYLLEVLDRVDTIDGDVKVCEGVQVWHVGGHSPGLLVVAVDTQVGRVVVGGDFFNTYVNLENDWPVGVLSSLAEWEESCQMLKSRADVIIPGHDYEVWQRHPSGTIG
jgi:glyoxylase-like metal-dependent hydrolase (beta-lactamase superfamily II)